MNPRKNQYKIARVRTPRAAHLRRVVLAAAAGALLGPGGAALATVGAPDSANSAGQLDNIAYGATGNVLDLRPLISVGGLGSPGDPLSVALRNPALSFSFSSSGAGSDLLQLRYTLSNSSTIESFNQLRFMVHLNPDGEQANFLDRVGESWGAAQAGGPTRRRAEAFTTPSAILASFAATGALTDGPPDAACTGAAGCDAVLALQWELATLAPKQQMVLTVGLSDNGRLLSDRHLFAIAADGSASELSLSGNIAVVPEPSTALMGLAGLAAMAALTRRRFNRQPA